MATHSNVLAYFHGQKSVVDYSSWGLKELGHDWVTEHEGMRVWLWVNLI